MSHWPLVRARKHEGTHSLDLTIPSSICKEFKIAAGDAFVVACAETAGKLVLTYRRVYKGGNEEKGDGS